jgi:hypothetical protein|tara:strand:+ start:2265 stop:2789 length:525 start_codon:yes stop_codon:yes gene_type:complete
MGIVVTKKEGGGYDEGWKTVVVSNAVKGDFNGSKYIDLHFEGYPETVKCRVWEARNKDGEEFSVSNMVRYINPTILEEMDRDGTAAASLDDSPNGLKGKTLQVLFYKKANGYSEISQKVAPAVPFQNIVDNFDENRITRIKESAEKYQARRNEANGVVTETTEGTSTNGNDTPW